MESVEPDLSPRSKIWLQQLVHNGEDLSRDQINEFTHEEATWYYWCKSTKPIKSQYRASTGSIPERKIPTLERIALFKRSSHKAGIVHVPEKEQKHTINPKPAASKNKRASTNSKKFEINDDSEDDKKESKNSSQRFKNLDLNCKIVFFLLRPEADEALPKDGFSLNELVLKNKAIINLNMKDTEMSPQVSYSLLYPSYLNIKFKKKKKKILCFDMYI
jgi:hypothetical protein